MSFEPPFSTIKSNKYSCANSRNVCPCGKTLALALPGGILFQTRAQSSESADSERDEEMQAKVNSSPSQEKDWLVGIAAQQKENILTADRKEGKDWKPFNWSCQKAQAEKVRKAALVLPFSSIFIYSSLFNRFSTSSFHWWEHGLWSQCQGLNLAHHVLGVVLVIYLTPLNFSLCICEMDGMMPHGVAARPRSDNINHAAGVRLPAGA